jgi:hypothetical protein
LPVPEWQSSQLIESISQRGKGFRSLRALAQVEYAGPEGKHGFQEAVVVERPNRLRLETLSMLGAILIVTVNEREIVGYHPREGVFVRGPATKANLRRYTKIPVELEEITMLLLGLPPVNSSMSGKQEGTAMIFPRDGRGRDVVRFEHPQPVPTEWQRVNGNDEVELTARFSDYAVFEAGLFPTKIVFESDRPKQKLEIRYQEPELNGAIQPDLFTQQKPPHAEEVPMEAIGG